MEQHTHRQSWKREGEEELFEEAKPIKPCGMGEPGLVHRAVPQNLLTGMRLQRGFSTALWEQEG